MLTRHKFAEPDIQWEDWDDARTMRMPLLALNASTYRPALTLDVPAGHRWDYSYVVSPNGQFAYRNTILPKLTPLEYFGETGITVWNGEVVLPTLIDMSIRRPDGRRFQTKTSTYRRSVDGAVWMSLTPAEMISQRPGVEMASGRVLVGGLGLGWFLQKVCEKSSVEEVVVVERSQELLDWYGYDLCRRQPKVNRVICGDVFAVLDEFPQHQLLLDIWPVYSGPGSAEADPRLASVRLRASDRVWAWGRDCGH